METLKEGGDETDCVTVKTLNGKHGIYAALLSQQESSTAVFVRQTGVSRSGQPVIDGQIYR